MLTLIATPWGGLPDLFVTVPLGAVAGIHGADRADTRRRCPSLGQPV